MALTLTRLPQTFAVCRLEPEEDVPLWALGGSFFTVSRTQSELSVVCEAERVPGGVRAEKGWRGFQFEGPFDFALTGVLASALTPLAEAGIGIFAISTFDTDYLFVKEEAFERAADALRGAGHQVR